MQIFVTGASGYVGSALIPLLQSAGHTILALSRRPESTKKLEAQDCEVLSGTLKDLDILAQGASQSDAVIHLAFSDDYAQFIEGCAMDLAAVTKIGETIKGTDKPFIITSGTLNLAGQGMGYEDSGANEGHIPRYLSEHKSASMAKEGVKSMVIRLSPSVHGKDDMGFVPKIFAASKENGVVAYVGDGEARWPSVDRRDAAQLYLLALENGKAGAVYHAVHDEGVKIKDLLDTVAEVLGLGKKNIEVGEAAAFYGFLGPLLAMDDACSSEKTRKELGWVPKERGLLEDIREGGWYKENVGKVHANL